MRGKRGPYRSIHAVPLRHGSWAAPVSPGREGQAGAGTSPRSVRITRRSVTMAVIRRGRRDVERGVQRAGAGRRRRHAAQAGDLVRAALLHLDPGAVGRRRVDRGLGRDHEERHAGVRAAPSASEKLPTLFAVSPLAAIRSAPISTTSARPRASDGRRRTVDEQPERGAHPVELPGRQPRPLEQRPGLERQCLLEPAAAVQLLDDAQRRAALHGGQRAGVADGHDPDLRAGPRAPRPGPRRGRPSPRTPRCPRRGSPGPRRGPRRPRTARRASARSVPQARLTAVGRAARSRAAPSRTASSSPRCRRASRATPIAPATPSAGAPRTASRRMASISASSVVTRSTRSSPGSRVWSIRRIPPSTQSIVRSVMAAHASTAPGGPDDARQAGTVRPLPGGRFGHRRTVVTGAGWAVRPPCRRARRPDRGSSDHDRRRVRRAYARSVPPPAAVHPGRRGDRGRALPVLL